MTMPLPTVQEYILSKTIRVGKCLIWKGCAKGRYGHFQYDNDIGVAHRKVYQIRKGEIPDGKILRHSCDDTRCVEIKHLIPGTKKQNRQDFMKRHPRAMEICLAANKIRTSGLKKWWANMTPIARKKFIKQRRDKQNACYRIRLRNFGPHRQSHDQAR